MLLQVAVAAAALLASVAANLDVTFCSDTQCKEEPLGTLRLDKASECRTDFAGEALGLEVAPTDTQDRRTQAVRFYRSTDCFGHCGSGHLIASMSNGFKALAGLAATPIMQSFELVDMDEEGSYPPHGYCGIRHGDAQVFRGRTWKWQQIGTHAFREIPIEEWDDAIHLQQMSKGYDLHGSVDSMGKYKMHQIFKNAWSGVSLEDWDDAVHIRNDTPVDLHDSVGAESL